MDFGSLIQNLSTEVVVEREVEKRGGDRMLINKLNRWEREGASDPNSHTIKFNDKCFLRIK